MINKCLYMFFEDFGCTKIICLLILLFGMVFHTDILQAQEDIMNFPINHLFLNREKVRFDKCHDVYGETRAYFDTISHDQGLSFKIDKNRCSQFKQGRVYLITYKSYTWRNCYDFDMDKAIITDIEENR